MSINFRESTTDDEICDNVALEADQDEDVGSEKHNACPMTNLHAAHIWLEHQPVANEYNVSMLRQFCTLVAQKTKDIAYQML
jgi:hypothetical protein